MILADIINSISNLADPCIDGDTCPASQFTAIAAAFSTIGYWVQADMLFQINKTAFGVLPALIYLLAAAGGIISMALGQPPRFYLWFFVGPAVFNWLVATPIEREGVRWAVGNQTQDQREVWKLAETGLINSIWRFRDGEAQVYNDKAPSKKAEVALFFDWMDKEFSHVIGWLAAWTGVNNLYANPQENSSLPGEEIPGGTQNDMLVNWHLLSNLKWSMLEDATGKAITNPNLFEAFITFWSSECGDALTQGIDKGKWAASHDATGRGMVDGVFEPHMRLYGRLKSKSTSSPHSLQAFFDTMEPGSFITSNAFYQDHKDFKWLIDQNRIKCDAFLLTVIDGIRWEAGHDYFNLLRNAPQGIAYQKDETVTAEEAMKRTEDRVVFNLFYGWDLRKQGDGETPGKRLTLDERKNFLKDLIFVHKLRNSMLLAPNRPAEDVSASKEVTRDADANIAAMQSKSKYAELYAWATMVPYLQGILLFLLVAAYPIAAMMTIVPGWHKAILTWLAFFVWVKLWDVGFAVVMVLERSIWSMLGTNSRTASLFTNIAGLTDFGKVVVKYDIPRCTEKNFQMCVPDVFTGNNTLAADATAGEEMFWDNFLKLLDRTLALANSVDLDRQNGYYVFIMSALYLAVPALTGQFVLGAKAGATSMVQSMFGGLASTAGQAAQSGYQGRAGNMMQASGQYRDLESRAKAFRMTPGQMAGYGFAGGWTPPTAAQGGGQNVAGGNPRAIAPGAAANAIGNAGNAANGNPVGGGNPGQNPAANQNRGTVPATRLGLPPPANGLAGNANGTAGKTTMNGMRAGAAIEALVNGPGSNVSSGGGKSNEQVAFRNAGATVGAPQTRGQEVAPRAADSNVLPPGATAAMLAASGTSAAAQTKIGAGMSELTARNVSGGSQATAGVPVPAAGMMASPAAAVSGFAARTGSGSSSPATQAPAAYPGAPAMNAGPTSQPASGNSIAVTQLNNSQNSGARAQVASAEPAMERAYPTSNLGMGSNNSQPKIRIKTDGLV